MEALILDWKCEITRSSQRASLVLAEKRWPEIATLSDIRPPWRFRADWDDVVVPLSVDEYSYALGLAGSLLIHAGCWWGIWCGKDIRQGVKTQGRIRCLNVCIKEFCQIGGQIDPLADIMPVGFYWNCCSNSAFKAVFAVQTSVVLLCAAKYALLT